jgi:DnaJ domain
VTHYEVLGVAVHATADEIRQAYRRRARDHHPDTNPADAAAGERFRQVALAYQVLSDPGRRARYDASLGRGTSAGRPAGTRPTPPGGTAPRPAAPADTAPAGPRPRWLHGPDAGAPEVTDRIVQAVFVVPLLVVPGIGFLARVVLVVAGWFAAGHLLWRHATAKPRAWPWWRSPGWTGGGRLLRVGAVAAGVVVAGIVLRPVADRAQEAADAQGTVEDAVTTQAQTDAQAQPPTGTQPSPPVTGAQPGPPGTASAIEAATDRRDEAVDDLVATWWRVPVAVAIVAAAWVGSARLPGRFGFEDRRARVR